MCFMVHGGNVCVRDVHGHFAIWVCKYFFESEIYMFWTVRYVKLLWVMSDYSVVWMQDMNSGVSHGYLSSNCLNVWLCTWDYVERTLLKLL